MARTGETMPLKAIAQDAGIPEHYLEQILGRLRQAGLVASVRGAQGGYKLARPAGNIFIGEIVEVAEDQLQPVQCPQDPCSHQGTCVNRDMWAKVTQSILSTLNGISLEELCRDSAPCLCGKMEE